ncbi:hypothetical protein [Butyrivibrio fibrisolvens]|uniref:hypothetical protein n=1 Tax=Butyrivibrio fibrisolvens TaxID=831 RepID=UPI00040EEC13|nr:hypothetical protein [Butyrivibrio fibrisolvens]
MLSIIHNVLSGIQYLFSTFCNFVINNNISIDKSVYITLLVGELTISAIYLSFCQFIFGAGDKNEVPFLGNKPFEFYIRKRLDKETKVIRCPFFKLLIAYQIIYKPIVAIYGSDMPKVFLSIMNFAWVTSVVVFFGFFVHLVLKCIVFTYSARGLFDKRSKWLYREMRKDFVKNHSSFAIKRKPIKQLETLCNAACEYAKSDKEKEYKEQYYYVISEQFAKYRKASQKNSWLSRFLSRFINKKNPLDIQAKFNISRELQLLFNLAEEEYFYNFKVFQKFIIRYVSEIIDTNSNIFSSNTKGDFGVSFYSIDECQKQVLNIVEAIYRNNGVEVRSRLVDEFILFKDKDFDGDMKARIGSCLINFALNDLYNGRIEKTDFKRIFNKVKYDEKYNAYFSENVLDKMLNENVPRYFADGVTDLLNEKNSNAVFLCIILFFTCYKFRFEWKDMNIEVLKGLYENKQALYNSKPRALELIETSKFNHRFNQSMLDYMLSTTESSITGAIIKDVYDNYSDLAFYWIIVKLLVFNDEFSIAASETDMNSLIKFINELARHDELFASDSIKLFIRKFRTYYTICSIPLPDGLEYSFNTLTILRADYTEIDFDKNPDVRFDRDVGKYILMKLPNNLNQIYSEHPEYIETVKESFIACDISVDKYIDSICEKAEALDYHINQVGRDRMKRNLEEIKKGKYDIKPTPIAPEPHQTKRTKSLPRKSRSKWNSLLKRLLLV